MKSRRKILWVILAVFGVFGCFALFLPQETQCDLESLILTDNGMPVGWTRFGIEKPPFISRQGAQDALGVVFDYRNGSDVAGYRIYRYKNAAQAYLYYRFNTQYFFPTGTWRWSDLVGSDDWGLNGDEERIQCVDNEPLVGNFCSAVVRYGPYISEFSSPIEAGGMSQAEFKAIVLAIDDRIASCLQQPNTPR